MIIDLLGFIVAGASTCDHDLALHAQGQWGSETGSSTGPLQHARTLGWLTANRIVYLAFLKLSLRFGVTFLWKFIREAACVGARTTWTNYEKNASDFPRDATVSREHLTNQHSVSGGSVCTRALKHQDTPG